jgi:hypothetical protein
MDDNTMSLSNALGAAQDALRKGTDGFFELEQELAGRLTGLSEAPVPKILNGSIDIVEDLKYVWTLNTSIEARKFVPRITINFKQQTKGQLREALNRWYENDFNILGGDAYKGLYLAEDVGQIIFPYFSPDYITLTQNFKESSMLGDLGSGVKKASGTLLGTAGRSIADAAGAAVNIAMGGLEAITPGVKIEKAHTWVQTSPTQTSFSFYLYNTLNQPKADNQPNRDTIKANKSLIDLLIHLNSVQKIGPALFLPPVLCEYTIPGIKHSPVANMSLNVQSVGQLTFIKPENVPDAYFITITLTDLLIRSRNMHTPSGPNDRISVFSTGG